MCNIVSVQNITNFIDPDGQIWELDRDCYIKKKNFPLAKEIVAGVVRTRDNRLLVLHTKREIKFSEGQVNAVVRNDRKSILVLAGHTLILIPMHNTYIVPEKRVLCSGVKLLFQCKIGNVIVDTNGKYKLVTNRGLVNIRGTKFPDKIKIIKDGVILTQVNEIFYLSGITLHEVDVPFTVVDVTTFGNNIATLDKQGRVWILNGTQWSQIRSGFMSSYGVRGFLSYSEKGSALSFIANDGYAYNYINNGDIEEVPVPYHLLNSMRR